MRRKSKDQRRAERKKENEQRKAALRKREWPTFLFDVEDADPRFVEEIMKAVGAFRFEELPDGYQGLFREMKVYGYDFVIRHLRAAMELVREKEPTDWRARVLDIAWRFVVGQVVLGKVPATVRAELLPFNDATFHYLGDIILVHCRSLVRVGQERLWHSRLKPTVEVGGKPYTVTFTNHAIDGITKRIQPDWMHRYAALGDVFAYLEQCVYFPTCRLRNVNAKTGGRQLAVTMFDRCVQRFWQWEYVEKVLGEANLRPELGPPYYRLGYCPAFPDEERGLLILGTMLLPGFDKTPEAELLQTAALPQEEMARLRELVIPDEAMRKLNDTGDYSALRWFHENGVPQVIQTKEQIYQPFRRKTFVISSIIKK
jgi:hypothetical protein